MNARLVCHPRRGAAREISLSHLPVLLGRAEESDVRLPDRWVSRRHCSLEDRHGVLVVKDLGSRHGTWLNDERVQVAELHPGDRLAIGQTTVTADYQDEKTSEH